MTMTIITIRLDYLKNKKMKAVRMMRFQAIQIQTKDVDTANTIMRTLKRMVIVTLSITMRTEQQLWMNSMKTLTPIQITQWEI